MKRKQRFTLLAMMLMAHAALQAQPTPEALLSQLPDPSAVNCYVDRAEIDCFGDLISKEQEKISQTIDRLQADAAAETENNKDKIASNAMRQAGLSKSDTRKLQQSDGSNQEGRKAAEKVVSEQYGISLQELEMVSEISEAEQKNGRTNMPTR